MSDESRSALDPEKIPRRRGLHIRDIKEEAPEPELTVGTELKAAREAAGKELNDVAAALRIKPEHLIALEAAEYDRLPAKTYVVGFVRQYAQQLGMDANEMVDRLKAELEGPAPAEDAPAGGRMEPAVKNGGPSGPVGGTGVGMVPSTEDESRLPVTTIAVIVILLLVVIFGGWYLTRPSGDVNAAADTEEETGSKAGPAKADGGQAEDGTNMPKTPALPAAANESSGIGTSARSGGSLTALLPGADRLSGPATANDPNQTPPRLKMPDAAAAAVPIEHSNDVSDEREQAAFDTADEMSRRDDGSGSPADGNENGSTALRTDEFVETAMPQPKLALRTVKSHLPGVPEDAVEDDEGGEPALEDIEAEGVGGEVESAEAAPPPAASARPQPKRVPVAEETAVYSASTAKSRVTLRVRSTTWVRVEDADGRIIMERDMRSGDSFRAPDMNGLYLVTKDAGAIELVLDGQSIGRAGRPKQVLTGLLLAPETLRQRVAQNAPQELQ